MGLPSSPLCEMTTEPEALSVSPPAIYILSGHSKRKRVYPYFP
jgi:hypothetical protein